MSHSLKIITFASAASLLQAQTVELDETVIVASRTKTETNLTAGTSTAIKSEELLLRGATTLTDALKYEPGVSIPFDTAGSDGLVPYLAGGDSTINIRGLEGNRISINIDGIRQPNDFTARAFGNTGGPGRIYFDPATFSQIELYKSAASSLYGPDALGGAISGRTESALTLLGEELTGTKTTNTTTYSSVNDSVHNRLAHAWGNGDWAYSLLYSWRLGHERENNSSEVSANPLDFQSHAFVSTLNWKPSINALLTFTTDYYRNDAFADLNSAEGDLGFLTNTIVTSDDTRERLRLSLDYSLESDGVNPLYDRLDLSAYWQEATVATDNFQQRFDGDLVNRLNDLDFETSITGISAQANKERSNHRLIYGIEGSYSEVAASFFRTNTSLFTGNVFTDDLIGMAPSEVIRLGAYISDEIKFLNDRLVITPTVRLDYYSVTPDNTAAFLSENNNVPATEFDNISISPSLSALYKITDELNVYGVWAQGTRNPTAEELNGVFAHGTDFLTVPNPDLSEERSNSFEIGLQYRDDYLKTQISGYYNFYKDFLEGGVLIEDNPVGTPDILTTVNRGEVDIYGFEVSADWLIGEQYSSLTGLSLGGSFSWSEGQASARLDAINKGDRPLNTVDPWKAVAYLAYNHPDESFGARLTATYVDEKSESQIDFSASDIRPSDTFLALDLTAYYQISEHFRLRAGVTNLLDEEYTNWATARRGRGHDTTGLPDSFYTQPSRAFFVAFDVSF